MTTIQETISNDVLSATPKTVAKKIGFLLQAFYANTEVLEQVQNFYDIVKTDSKYKDALPEIDKSLKKFWLEAWTKNGIDAKHVPIVENFYSRYSALQQEKLKPYINSLGLAHTPKKTSALTLALTSYKEGNPEELMSFIESATTINSTESDRINSVFFKRILPGSFLSYISFMQKGSLSAHTDLNTFDILEQKPEEFKVFFDAYKKKINKNHNHWGGKFCIQHWMREITGLDCSKVEDFNQTNGYVLVELSKKNPDAIISSLENINYATQQGGKVYDNFVLNQLKLSTKGVETIFANVGNLKKDFNELMHYFSNEVMTQAEFVACVKIVHSTYLAHNLQGSLGEKTDTKSKMKI